LKFCQDIQRKFGHAKGVPNEENPWNGGVAFKAASILNTNTTVSATFAFWNLFTSSFIGLQSLSGFRIYRPLSATLNVIEVEQCPRK